VFHAKEKEMSPDTKALAQAWVTYWREYGESGAFPQSPASEAVESLARTRPSEALAVILEILRMIDASPENMLFQVLAAGPVEELLGYRGAAIIEQVEAEALRNPQFKLLLGGVWKGRMPDDVWERLKNCRGSEWECAQ
jgi:hypothetical protein